MAGVHLMPLLCSMAFGTTSDTVNSFRWPNAALGSFFGGAASSRKNFTSPVLMIAACLILLGCGLLSTLGGGREFYTPTYGYQFILGLGIGLTFSSSTLLASLASKPEDVAASQGALAQARMLGGSIGLSISTIVLNNKLRNGLAGALDPPRIKSLQQSLSTISTLSPANQGLVAQLFSEAFNDQMRICTYLSAATLLAAIATYQKNPPSVAAMKERQNATAGESSDESNGMSSNTGTGPVQPESGGRERRLDS
ncbi:MAG: hypothetical protein Q9163_001488 [Psora crenata]